MKRNALVLFSGGKDSFLTSLLMREKGYKVYLITYENGCGLKSKNAINGAKRIEQKYGKDKVEILGVQNIEAIWREFLVLYYNNKPSKNLKEYGDLPISQFNCLSCRLSMYVMSIIVAKQRNISTIVDGARQSQIFAIEQNEMLDIFKNWFLKHDLDIEFPLRDLKDDFELKNQILIRGFVPKTIEPQCLIGMPITEKYMDDEIIKATGKVFNKLLMPKADELINRYKDIKISGEYV